MSFETFGFGKDILRATHKAGYEKPTQVQSLAIPKIMAGHDVTGIAQTGTGKTAAFVLPILERLINEQSNPKAGCKAMVLVPTRELAIQIMKNVRTYADGVPIRVAAVYGGVDDVLQLKALKRGVHVIVATPGRLIDFIERQRLDFSQLETLVLDEADRMLDMGFLSDIKSIIEELPKRRQTLMFSATFSKEIESLAKRFQYQPKMVQVGKRSNPADTVEQSVYCMAEHLKGPHLAALLEKKEMTRVLVFVKMKDRANALTQYLKGEGLNVSMLHSSRSQEQRNEALQAFKDGVIQVLVATDVAARGIDVVGVSHVVNYDFPVNPEDYVHRIGRTGRAESSGEAISFVPDHDLNLLDYLELQIGQRLPRKRLKGFDYKARSSKNMPNVSSSKKDWRKRTRQREKPEGAKKSGSSKKPSDSGRKAPRRSKSPKKNPRSSS